MVDNSSQLTTSSYIPGESWLSKEQSDQDHYRLVQTRKKVAKALIKVLESTTREVLFPFPQPYDCQVKIIESVLKCIE